MPSYDDDEVVGSLIGDDSFGESISATKQRRMGRDGFDDASAPSTTMFDRTFDQAFRSRRRTRIDPALKRAAREEGFGDGSIRDRADRSTAIYQRMLESQPARARRRVVLDGATDEVQVIDPDADVDLDLDADHDAFEDSPEPSPRRSRAELLATLADLDRQAAALAGATESPAAQARPVASTRQPAAATVAQRPLQVGPSGDPVESLDDLIATLGLSEQTQQEAADEEPPEPEPEAISGEDLPTIDDDPEDLYMLDQERDEDHEHSASSTSPVVAAMAESARAYIPAAKTDDHCSPLCIARALFRTWGDTDLDPCASKNPHAYVEAETQWFGPREDDVDGLSMPWFGKAYINPPYGREIKDWIDKIVLEMDIGSIEAAIALLPIRSDVPWFHDDVLAGATAVCFIRGRLKFGGAENSAPFPSIVVLWGDEHFEAFKQAFEVDKDPERGRPLGTVVDLRSRGAAAAAAREAAAIATRDRIATALELRWTDGGASELDASARETIELIRSGQLEAA